MLLRRHRVVADGKADSVREIYVTKVDRCKKQKKQSELTIRNPDFYYILKYNSANLSVPQNNLSVALANNAIQNPLLISQSFRFYKNITGDISTQQTSIIFTTENCSLYNYPGDMCYLRGYESPAGGLNMYKKVVDPITGDDLSDEKLAVKNYIRPFPMTVAQAMSFQPPKSFYVSFIAGINRYGLLYRTYYYGNSSDYNSLRSFSPAIDCLDYLTTLLTQYSPSPNSVLFILDDLGLMVASMLNGTASQIDVLLSSDCGKLHKQIQRGDHQPERASFERGPVSAQHIRRWQRRTAGVHAADKLHA
ncbi:hypothetical protein HDU82_000185 [Entophlyctis luteolus]|nr:hypothetical protein HDU82_000185 [Entophlyctis luteolus]